MTNERAAQTALCYFVTRRAIDRLKKERNKGTNSPVVAAASHWLGHEIEKQSRHGSKLKRQLNKALKEGLT